MSLQEVSLRAITFKQYAYKLKGYSNLFYGLLIAQILGLLFSMGGVGNMGATNDSLRVSLRTYSSNVVIVFSFLWIFISASSLGTKPYRNMEFSLVTNALSSNLSNVGILLTCSVFGGITSSLIGVLLRTIVYFTFSRTQIVLDGFFIAPTDLILGIFVTSLYMLLISSVAYLARMLVEINMALAIIIPLIGIGLLRIYNNFFMAIYTFIILENSWLLFTLKVLILSIILFGISVLLANRMEVRK